ncbi:MAG TPA: S8 family serine peptidase [Actinomycetota bacterium]|nr:S8 family serine peptidase [Actinomycetota bacterium]
MTGRRVGAAVAALLLAMVANAAAAEVTPTPAVALPGAGDVIAGEYIVVLKNGAAPRRAATRHARVFGLNVGHVYRHALKGYSARIPRAAVPLIAQLPGVRWVEPARVVTAAAQTVPTGVNRAEADLSPTARINGSDERVDIDVAVIDTGVNLSHPDLNVYRAGAKNCVLVSLGGANDDHGHGTHVAGTIGALDNSSDVVGVAPGARIWPVKVLNLLGTGSTADVICGIDYVTSKAAEIDVANMSLGGSGRDDNNCGNSNNDSQHKAICRSVGAGVTYVVAAGNSSADAAGSVPAAYDEVITVSALADFNGVGGGGAAPTCRTDEDDSFASFSNYGADVDVIAPGVCILSTRSGGGTTTMSGTSMASPHVAGGAALYLAQNPDASPAAVRSALMAAGSDDWSSTDDRDGTKEPLLNVAAF